MEIDAISKLISNVGFPTALVVLCIVALWRSGPWFVKIATAIVNLMDTLRLNDTRHVDGLNEVKTLVTTTADEVKSRFGQLRTDVLAAIGRDETPGQ